MHYQRALIQVALVGAIYTTISATRAAEPPALPIVKNVELQPLIAQVKRVIEATDYLGIPLSGADRQTLEAAFKKSDSDEASELIQRSLDKYCLIAVNINPESRVKVAAGPAKPELVEKGWRQFLVKIHNEAGVTGELRAVSPNAQSVHNSDWKKTPSDDQYRKRDSSAPENDRELWLNRH
jgi:hypothetical protein